MFKRFLDLLMYQVDFWTPEEPSSGANYPVLNVDGTPMMGAFDMNGNPYGITSSSSMFNND